MKVNKLFLLAMGLVAVGCNDSQIEEQSLINDAQGELVEVEIAATIAPASRATSNVGEYGGVTAVDLKFEVEDHIGVYLNNEAVGLTHENTDFKVTSLDGGAATFVPQQDMILLGHGNNVYAYYPFLATDAGFEGSVSRSSKRGTWDGYHYFNIPAVQQQDTIEVAGEPNPYGNLKKYVKLIAKETQMYKQGNKMKADLVFYHAFGYATMNVQNTYDREMKFVEATVQLLDEAGEPMPIAGDFAAALDNEGNEALLVKASDAEGATSATVVKVNSNDPDGVLTLDPGQSAYITAAVAPVDCRGYEVRLVTDKGFVYKVRKTNLDPAFAVGQGVNRKLSIPVSDATLSSEVVNSEVAEYLLHMDKEHIVLDVAANIELKIDRTSDDAWGGPSTKTVTINGGADGLATNRTVSFNMSEQVWSDVDLVNTDATLYIKNIKLQTTGWDPNSKAGYSRTDLMFNCKVDMEKVISLSAMMAHRSVNMNTVVVFDLKAGSSTNNYALWLAPTVEEQVVNINGFQTLNMTAKGMRGIKIDADTSYASFDESGLGPQKVILTLDGDNYFNTTKKAAILVRTKVGAEINIKGNNDITNVVDDQTNLIWIDEATKSKEYVEKISIKNARWKLEGAAWSAENDATGNLVTAYADNNAGMNEALSYGKNTIELVNDGTYTLPDMSARQISLSGGAGAIIRVSDNHTNLTDCTLTLKGVTLSSSDPDVNGIKKATALICSGVTVKPIALYGMQAVFVGCTFDLTTSNGNGDYIYVKEANTVNFTNCKFDTNGKAILISNPSEEGNYASKVTVTDCEFYNKGGKPGYTSGALATQACAAIEISNKHNSGVGAAHTLTTSGNTVAASFSGEWRIKDYQAGNVVTVNGVAYEQIALDGKKMVVTDEGILFE